MKQQSKSPCILVVDDIPDNIAVVFDFLRARGFKVLVSESGRHALEELPQMAPDLILLDVRMPEMDGLETCQRLKADARHADIPVLFMTALDDPLDKVRGFEAGAADYITKPIFPEEVLARIRVHLELRAAQAALAERNRVLEEQNERLDAAMQRQRLAEQALRDSLDRAALVVDAGGEPLFLSDSARRLLARYFPNWPGSALPEAIVLWLCREPLEVLRVQCDSRALTLTPVLASGEGHGRLIYLDEAAPQPSPELLMPLGLTPRESEVLFWVAQGKTTPDIALMFGNSPATIKKHVENIMLKLGVETRLAAALKAMEFLGLRA